MLAVASAKSMKNQSSKKVPVKTYKKMIRKGIKKMVRMFQSTSQDSKIVRMKNKEVANLDMHNQVAKAQYSEKPEGQHEFDQAEEYDLYVKVVNSISGDVHPLTKQVVNLNSLGTVFITKVQNDIREVDQSISLLSIVNKGEMLAEGRCCTNVGELIQGMHVTTSDGPEMLSCYSITDKYNVWSFCSSQLDYIYAFREKIRMTIITQWYTANNLPTPDFVIDNNFIGSITYWSWADQESWSLECRAGRYQSPIEFESAAPRNVVGPKLMFNYYDAEMRAKFNTHEVEVLGDFGNIQYQSDEYQVNYEAYKLTFKFPQEHVIDGVKHDGELQVHHVAADGTQAIVSFFLDASSNEEIPSNFWQKLSPQNWETTSNKEVFLPLGSGLHEVVSAGTLNKNFRKSFYHYKGSESVPPCTEGVYRFIMEETIQVPQVVLNTVRQNVVAEGQIGGNARATNKFHDMILYHKDTSDYCPPDSVLPDSIAERVREQLDEIKTKNDLAPKPDKQVLDNPEDKKRQYTGKFIKTSSDVDTFVYTKPDDYRREQMEGGETVEPTELPTSMKRDLVRGLDVSQLSARKMRFKQKKHHRKLRK